METTPAVVGFGNPLLDITVNVSADYLAKYKLARNTAILAGPEHMSVYDEIFNMNYSLSCGGACLNTMRAVQWMAQTPKTAAYVGCVGVDRSASMLRNLVEQAGVDGQFMETDKAPNGRCACLICETDRNLVTHLGAADLFDKAHIFTEKVQKVINGAKAFYAEGYFLTVSSSTLLEVGQIAARANKPFVFNLSANFLIEVPPFFEHMKKVLPYVDYVFCNENEATVFASKFNWGTDLSLIAKNIGDLDKVNKARTRTVVITHNAEPTVVYHNGKISLYPTPKIPRSEIVDTNGAGDSFVGGFLSEFLHNTETPDMLRCISAAQYCARKIITVSGCCFPGKPAFRHKDQKRKASGEPYIAHPIGVARILTDAFIEDPATLQAAILHEYTKSLSSDNICSTVEDTNTKPEEIELHFGKQVMHIVMEVTDDKKLPKEKRKQLQIEHSAHLSTEAKLVKLAGFYLPFPFSYIVDKIHNLRDLSISSPWKFDITQGYFVWAWFVCAGLRGNSVFLDATVDGIFLNATLVSPNGSIVPALPSTDNAVLKPMLDKYLKEMANSQ